MSETTVDIMGLRLITQEKNTQEASFRTWTVKAWRGSYAQRAWEMTCPGLTYEQAIEMRERMVTSGKKAQIW